MPRKADFLNVDNAEVPSIQGSVDDDAVMFPRVLGGSQWRQGAGRYESDPISGQILLQVVVGHPDRDVTQACSKHQQGPNKAKRDTGAGSTFNLQITSPYASANKLPIYFNKRGDRLI